MAQDCVNRLVSVAYMCVSELNTIDLNTICHIYGINSLSKISGGY